MKGLLYGIKLQFQMDIRSKTLLVTCYLVPLLFFFIMGGIFISLIPDAKNTLLSSMTVMGVSMGALIGVPPAMVEIYRSDIKKMYLANGIPVYFGITSLLASAFIHLIIMSFLIFVTAPVIFHARIPSNIFVYGASLVFLIATSLSLSCILGLTIKNQAKLTVYSQIFFLPSILLSGIMFSTDFLPPFLKYMGKLFPATWGYLLLSEHGLYPNTWIPLFLILIITLLLNFLLLKNIRTA